MNNQAVRSDQLLTQFSAVSQESYPVCSICDEFQVSPINFFLTCIVCKTKVHADCWKHGNMRNFTCLRCEYSKNRKQRFSSIKCRICNKYEGFLLHRYYSKEWIHFRCVEGIRANYLDKDACIYCEDKAGTKIKCRERGCDKKFHSMCCVLEGYYKADHNGNKIYYCKEHYAKETGDRSKLIEMKRELIDEVLSRREFSHNQDQHSEDMVSDTDSIEDLQIRKLRSTTLRAARKTAYRPCTKRTCRQPEVIDLVSDSDSELESECKESLEVTPWVLVDQFIPYEIPYPAPSEPIAPSQYSVPFIPHPSAIDLTGNSEPQVSSVETELPSSLTERFPYIK